MKKTSSRNSKNETTKFRIIKEAVKLFSQRGYHGTSIDHIARSAGFTKGAIYWHFKSKDEILK
ncbi:helix-turn-helix domain-containing protein, partial [Thermodesulfobacteriota bacterium]